MTNPTNELYLLSNVDLDPDYNYTLDFDNETAQHTYFENKVANVLLHTDDYSYIRADQSIKVYANIDTLNSVNYLMYKNADKWYYGFVTKKEYVSDKVTRLIFKIDPLQTFMFDYSLEESFIDREHQDRWKLNGANIDPLLNREAENLEKGKEYYRDNERQTILDNVPDNFSLGKNQDKSFQMYWLTIVAKESIGKKSWSTAGGLITGDQPSETRTTSVKGMYNNVFTYVAPLPIFMGNWLNMPVVRAVSKTGITASDKIVSCLTSKQVLDMTQDPKIISINISRYCPFGYGCDKDTEAGSVYTATRYKLYPLPAPEGTGVSDINLSCYEWNSSNNKGYGAIFFINNPNGRSYPVFNTGLNLKSKLASAINKDNLKDIALETKLLMSDYSYYELELGAEKIKINYEDLDANELKLEYANSYSVKNGRALIPLNYKKVERCLTDMLTYDSTINEMPLRTDAWLTYLSQNKSSMMSGFITSTLQTTASIGLGLATGGTGFAVAGAQALSFAGNIANSMAQINDLKNRPDEVNKTALDLVLDYVTRDLYITINRYDIHSNFKNKIFNYFYHYGYKCNDFKKPNVRSRYYFNYIKTIGANIKSNIDADYKAEIATIFDKGITIWHYRDATTFKGVNNFEYENAEITLIGGTNGN